MLEKENQELKDELHKMSSMSTHESHREVELELESVKHSSKSKKSSHCGFDLEKEAR
jgi:hypothetical protein